MKELNPPPRFDDVLYDAVRRMDNPEGTNIDRLEEALNLVIQQYVRAIKSYPPYHSAHEGYAVILEEVRELEAEVFKKADGDLGKLKSEAAQIAATALRFLTDFHQF